jgi:hypothetical protein
MSLRVFHPAHSGVELLLFYIWHPASPLGLSTCIVRSKKERIALVWNVFGLVL